jgi:hypothetical protein
MNHLPSETFFWLEGLENKVVFEIEVYVYRRRAQSMPAIYFF